MYTSIDLPSLSLPHGGAHGRARRYWWTGRQASWGWLWGEEESLAHLRQKAAPMARPSAKLWKASPRMT